MCNMTTYSENIKGKITRLHKKISTILNLQAFNMEKTDILLVYGKGIIIIYNYISKFF